VELNGKQPESNPAKDIFLSHWKDDRTAIHSWLQEEAPSLAELYESAVRLRFEIQIPGRVRLIGHCLREICNGLLNIKLGQASKVQHKDLIENLAKNWEKKGLTIDGNFLEVGRNSQTNLPSSSPDIYIPREVYREIVDIIKKHIDNKKNSFEERIRLFLTKCISEDQLVEELLPQVNQWKKMSQWLVTTAHDNGKVDKEYTEDELLYWFDIFEAFLSTFAQDFYNTTDEIDDILEEANSSTA
jgi:hypothetical protein